MHVVFDIETVESRLLEVYVSPVWKHSNCVYYSWHGQRYAVTLANRHLLVLSVSRVNLEWRWNTSRNATNMILKRQRNKRKRNWMTNHADHLVQRVRWRVVHGQAGTCASSDCAVGIVVRLSAPCVVSTCPGHGHVTTMSLWCQLLLQVVDAWWPPSSVARRDR